MPSEGRSGAPQREWRGRGAWHRGRAHSPCMEDTHTPRRTPGGCALAQLRVHNSAYSVKIQTLGALAKLLTIACSPTFIKGARPLRL
jgi:hypothetical protein